ncbi:unnamed protein product, partial [Callosobruchus maculatus]
MLKNCPEPFYVQDLQFKLRCRLKVFDNEKVDIFTDFCSLVSAASRYGLLFVGSFLPILQDDTTISVKADTLHQATHLLHEVETEAKHWFAANKLVLNEEKTERIVFSLRDCGAINGELTDIRFLGVTIDPTLKWNVHIDNISTRLTKAIYLLRS